VTAERPDSESTCLPPDPGSYVTYGTEFAAFQGYRFGTVFPKTFPICFEGLSF
jgi:hypothetical protein